MAENKKSKPSKDKVIQPVTTGSGFGANSGQSIKKMVADTVAISAQKQSVEPPSKKQNSNAVKTAKKTVTAGKAKTATPQQTIHLQKKETIMKEKFEKITGETFVKVDEITKLVQENTDAYLKFVSKYAKGLEEVRQSYFDYSRAAFEKSAEASKELLSAKTVGEFTEKQSKFAQNALNDFVTETTKLSEKTIKVTTEAAEPLKSHIEHTVENLSKKIAA